MTGKSWWLASFYREDNDEYKTTRQLRSDPLCHFVWCMVEESGQHRKEKRMAYTQTTEKQESKKKQRSREKTKETDIGKKLQECIAEKDYLSNYVVTSDALYFAVGQEKSGKTRLYKADIDSRKIFPSKVDFCDPQYLEINFRKY